MQIWRQLRFQPRAVLMEGSCRVICGRGVVGRPHRAHFPSFFLSLSVHQPSIVPPPLIFLPPTHPLIKHATHPSFPLPLDVMFPLRSTASKYLIPQTNMRMKYEILMPDLFCVPACRVSVAFELQGLPYKRENFCQRSISCSRHV